MTRGKPEAPFEDPKAQEEDLVGMWSWLQRGDEEIHHCFLIDYEGERTPQDSNVQYSRNFYFVLSLPRVSLPIRMILWTPQITIRVTIMFPLTRGKTKSQEKGQGH